MFYDGIYSWVTFLVGVGAEFWRRGFHDQTERTALRGGAAGMEPGKGTAEFFRMHLSCNLSNYY